MRAGTTTCRVDDTIFPVGRHDIVPSPAELREAPVGRDSSTCTTSTASRLRGPRPSISHHLTLAGRSDPLFSDALALIHQTSRGIRWELNHLANQALIAHGPDELPHHGYGPRRGTHDGPASCRHHYAGVLTPHLRHHHVGGLHVASGAAAPNSIGAANPTLTIVALALRLAEHLADGAQ